MWHNQFGSSIAGRVSRLHVMLSWLHFMDPLGKKLLVRVQALRDRQQLEEYDS